MFLKKPFSSSSVILQKEKSSSLTPSSFSFYRSLFFKKNPTLSRCPTLLSCRTEAFLFIFLHVHSFYRPPSHNRLLHYTQNFIFHSEYNPPRRSHTCYTFSFLCQTALVSFLQSHIQLLSPVAILKGIAAKGFFL